MSALLAEPAIEIDGMPMRHPLPDAEGVLDYESETQTHIVHGRSEIARAVVPFTVEIPEHKVDEVAMILAPGYLATEFSYEGLRHYLATQGKTAITFDMPRLQSGMVGLHPKHLFHPELLASQSVWAIQREVRKHDGYGEFDGELYDAMGHSKGGQTVALAAEHKPSHFRHITFVGSAGINGHNLGGLMIRGGRFIGEELIADLPQLWHQYSNHAVRMMGAEMYHVGRNVVRTAAEGLSVAVCDIRPIITHLGEMGIKTAVLSFGRDTFFDQESVKANIAHLVDIFHQYENTDAHHIEPQRDPAAVGRALLDIEANLQRLAT